MKEGPSDKLFCFQSHGLLPVAICVVPPEEGDIAVPQVEDAVIADRDPVGVPAEVLVNLWTNGTWHVFHPQK